MTGIKAEITFVDPARVLSIQSDPGFDSPIQSGSGFANGHFESYNDDDDDVDDDDDGQL